MKPEDCKEGQRIVLAKFDEASLAYVEYPATVVSTKAGRVTLQDDGADWTYTAGEALLSSYEDYGSAEHQTRRLNEKVRGERYILDLLERARRQLRVLWNDQKGDLT